MTFLTKRADPSQHPAEIFSIFSYFLSFSSSFFSVYPVWVCRGLRNWTRGRDLFSSKNGIRNMSSPPVVKPPWVSEVFQVDFSRWKTLLILRGKRERKTLWRFFFGIGREHRGDLFLRELCLAEVCKVCPHVRFWCTFRLSGCFLIGLRKSYANFESWAGYGMESVPCPWAVVINIAGIATKF